MCGFVAGLIMRIVAGTAPKPVVALLPTRTAAQLLRLADDAQWRVVPRIADKHGEGLFEHLAGHEIVPVSSRIENARLSLQMALFADTVSGIWREALRVDDIGARRHSHMQRGRAVTSLA